MTVFVVDKNGKPLMPTNRLGKVRHMLKNGEAVIYKHDPFTIQLTYDSPGYVQPMEMCIDTGYQNVGVSVKSESKEYVSEEYELLKDEKSKHDDCRSYRRTKRNRKTRYRKPRFNNRKSSKPEGWLAPSIKNKADRQVDIIKKYIEVCPIIDVHVEVGQFDTQLLQAIEEGKPIPQGKDYQQGPTYGSDTLREAVFQRDNYTCVFCGKSAIKDSVILHTHHVYFWKGRHADRLDELATCCDKCHTSANHQKSGKLWGYDKKMKTFTGAAFMNTVRWYIVNELKTISDITIHTTYGSETKHSRLNLNLPKTHANDAYSMGKFHPSIRPETEHYKKRRRNNRCLEKFYDAKYIDIRDGKKKFGKELGCERTNRRELRSSDKNLRIYHGEKTSKGRRTIRTKRYELQPHDVVLFENKKYIVVGIQNNGDYVKLNGMKPVSVKKVKLIKHCSGYYKTSKGKNY